MPTADLIADRAEITDLFARLASLLDERRPEDAGTVFHDDIETHSPHGELHGLAEVIAHLRESGADGVLTQHVHADVLVNLDGDRATAIANQIAYFFRDGEAPHRTSGLRAAYTVVRTPAGWRFREMRLTLAWTQEN